MGNPANKGYHCWVTNRTKTYLCIADLNCHIPPMRTWDLLDYKHSNFTVEQVTKSIESGSLKKKFEQKKIYIRQVAPTPSVGREIPISKVNFPRRRFMHIAEIQQKHFEELDETFEQASDLEYAKEFAELNFADHSAQLDLNKTVPPKKEG